MADIEAILFDKDGTLFDFEATWGAWARALLIRLAEGDPPRTERLAEALGYDLTAGCFHRHSPVIAGTVSEVATLMLPHLPGRTAPDLVAELEAAALEAPQVPAVDLPRCLGDLCTSGLRLGVATNDSEASARLQLQREGVETLFDFIAGYDSGHGAKPEPGPLLAFAAAVGVAPERVAMVGDSLHDLAAARAAGMTAVAVLTGPATREVLSPAADVVLETIDGLAEWLALAPARG
ncbi:phosphoglycolate phosphatase [Rhodobacter sp. JA431]|uniref:HAD family hydrolase n=1 Tax=Rhodobacter sp. JA431 TaxID=570013 RepID=UPI000BDCA866|nr:HAD family hydrolase [Rhodobacter sp. JA431]SOB90941.1 phosphoglycolate phosphatase [Rhodobacter sp. JA431]